MRSVQRRLEQQQVQLEKTREEVDALAHEKSSLMHRLDTLRNVNQRLEKKLRRQQASGFPGGYGMNR